MRQLVSTKQAKRNHKIIKKGGDKAWIYQTDHCPKRRSDPLTEYRNWFYFSLQNDLKLANEIKMFKLGAELDDYCIVFTADYRDHVRRVMAELSISKNVCSKSIQLELYRDSILLIYVC